ncbi:MAG TPA: MFS transporter [Steroidobacteraceae bacterium]|nr:MFS transporter [Steroidobacteraceae bacterium]
MTRYQWLVIFAAWCGWGFDVFDAILFNFVAPNCVPLLLGLEPGSPDARSATLFWTGIITAILLIGWASGGLLFGLVADRIGRKRTLLITILMYSVGTALCAAANDIWQLAAFRAIASLGIGGEWAVGAALVAEAVPDSRRVEAGSILFTASPLGFALAGYLNYQIAGVWLASSPETSWRYVFVCGLIPAALAILVRWGLRESERWQQAVTSSAPPRPAELFAPAIRTRTFSGLFTAVMALLAWWTVGAFAPILSASLARDHALLTGLDATAMKLLAETWKAEASNWFNIGGVLGALLSIPLAKLLSRRAMFIAYYLVSLLAILAIFGLELDPHTRVRGFFALGVGIYGIFAVFTFYLPELFPTRLRAMGSGVCYNSGRLLTAGGAFLVGALSARAGGSSSVLLTILLWAAVIPAAGVIGSRWIVETRNTPLPD